MAEYEVQFVTLSGGKAIPAYKLVCPQCMALDIHTDVDTSVEPWKARCSRGHAFTVDPRPDA